MDDMATWTHPLSSGRIKMSDTSLAADGLCLAARASRTPGEHATVLSIAGKIVRGTERGPGTRWQSRRRRSQKRALRCWRQGSPGI
jgi:hypothetical protein